MKQGFPRPQNILNFFLPFSIGLFTFIIVYGLTPLNVTNDSWIMAGYDEKDIIQHYSGWIAYRNSDRTFPLGMAMDMAWGDGTYISFTDSIPWVAIAFKLIRRFLPDTFQYFGIYALFCYIMQGIAAFNIIYYKCKNTIYSGIGTILFTFAPILLERSLRHTALGSQWLILFAILIYLVHKNSPLRKIHYFEYLVLLVLAIGIHPYFLPSIAVFLLLSVIYDIKRRQFLAPVFFILNLVITYFSGRLIGVLGTNTNVSRDGYGYYSMNLNALINPTSCGGYIWSSFQKVYPQTLGNYDGFNYLGAGIIAGFFLLLIFTIAWDMEKNIWKFIKRNGILLFFLVCCFSFAISNVVTLNDKILFDIPLPQWLEKLCGIFRASSRIFYPVYYCIFISIIYGIWQFSSPKLGKKKACAFLGLIVLIQVFDIHLCIIEKHQTMDKNASYISLLDDQKLNDILQDNQYIILDNYTGDSRSLAVVALKNHMKLYFSTANSGAYWSSHNNSLEIANTVKETGEIESYVIVTSDLSTADSYLKHENIGCYQSDENYYLYQLDLISAE